MDTTSTLCECGCGLPAPIAPQSSTRFGWVRGQPMRFRRGHAARLQPKDPIESRWEVMPNGCWEWRRFRIHGYGYLRHPENGRNVRAHRFVYERYRGPIPGGLPLDHLCRNRACVNPDHLEPVTQRENVLRSRGAPAVNAALQACRRGHPFDEANTYVSGGRRHCRACRAARAADRRRQAGPAIRR